MPQQQLKGGVYPKSHWGCNSLAKVTNIISLNDYEILYVVGCQVIVYNIGDQRSKVLPLQCSELQMITTFSVSSDMKFLALATKFSPHFAHDKKAQLLCYDYESFQAIPKRPQIFEFNAERFDCDEFHFTSLAFSTCSALIVITTSIVEAGMILYDRAAGTVLHQVPTTGLVLRATFNPTDKSRLCSTGKNSLFSFWRCTDKVVHSIPIDGLRRGGVVYTCHSWHSENKVIAGTDSGCLVFASGGDSGSSRTSYAFGAPTQSGRVDSPVTSLLVRNDIVMATSAFNHIALFEVRRAPPVTGGTGVSHVLVKLARFRFATIAAIVSLQWAVCSTSSSYELVMSTPNGINIVDLKATDYRMAVVDNPSQTGTRTGKPTSTQPAAITSSDNNNNTGSENGPVDWIEHRIDRVVLTYHCGGIHSMSTASRTSTFVTAGEDNTIRVWDYAKPDCPGMLIDNFSDRKNVVPNSVHMHPTGVYVAFGCEDDVREFCITDTRFELVRKLPTKIPYTGPNGVPFVNTAAVSLVRYSHGGHLLAAVTGRLAQVFHMFNLDYGSGEASGTPSRVMALTDHKATILDLEFSHDDAYIYTCAIDGTVYSWKTFATTRSGEYIGEKSTQAIKIVVSCGLVDAPKMIVASFATEVLKPNLPAARKTAVLTRRKQSSLARKPESGAASLRMESSRGSSLMRSESMLITDDDAASPERKQTDQRKRQYLCVWKDEVTVAPQIIWLDVPVTSLAFGRMDGHWANRDEFLVMGLQDGRILISVLPLPIKVLTVPEVSIPFGLSRKVSASPSGGQSNGVGRSAILVLDNAGISTKVPLSRGGTPNAGGFVPMASPDRPSAIQMESTNSNGAATPTAESTPSAAVAVGNAAVAGTTVSARTNAADEISYCLDFALCLRLQLHASEVTTITVAPSGFWIFTSGGDGAIFMLSTSIRAKEFSEIPEATAMENGLLVTEKSQLLFLRARMEEVDSSIAETRRDCERSIHKIIEQKNGVIEELESRMKHEVKKRDDIILWGREENSRLNKKLVDDIADVEKKLTDEMEELEYAYERKLTQESLYLEKMRQAFDEVVVHSRMDMLDASKQATAYEAKLLDQRKEILEEGEKQKSLVLAYVDYIRARYGEVINRMEEGQEEERGRLKQDLVQARSTVASLEESAKEEIISLNRQINDLNGKMTVKEEEVFKVKSDLEWANTRIHKLETALQQATQEVRRHIELSEKWEFKVGDYQEQNRDLEKIRKSLTSQLHLLRQEVGPKEEKLMQATERLKEVGREYERAIYSISEKEQNISRKGESLHLLQKQLGELRNACQQKDASLRRAAKLFEEYKHIVQQNSFKKNVMAGSIPVANTSLAEPSTTSTTGMETLNDNKSGGQGTGELSGREEKPARKHPTGKNIDKVCMVVKTEGMDNSLKMLDDVLHPYLFAHDADVHVKDDAQADFEERERQVQQLHDNISGLKTNLDHSKLVSTVKIRNHVTDNLHLLKEVNDLRHDVRQLSFDNQRLTAQIKFMEQRQRAAARTVQGAATATVSRTTASSSIPQQQQQDQLLISCPSSPLLQSQPPHAVIGSVQQMVDGLQFLNSGEMTDRSMNDADLLSETANAMTSHNKPPADNAILSKREGAKTSSAADMKIAELFKANEAIIRSKSAATFQDELTGLGIVLSENDNTKTGIATQSGKSAPGKKPKQTKLGHSTIVFPDVHMKTRK